MYIYCRDTVYQPRRWMSLRPASTSFIRTSASGKCRPDDPMPCMFFSQFAPLNCPKPEGNSSFSDHYTTITYYYIPLHYLT